MRGAAHENIEAAHAFEAAAHISDNACACRNCNSSDGAQTALAGGRAEGFVVAVIDRAIDTVEDDLNFVQVL